MSKFALTRAAALAAVLLLAGGARAADAVTTNQLKQIGLAYHNYHDANNKGPAKADDLGPYVENDKALLGHLKEGRVVFFYGVKITDMTEGTSNTVLAHEKDVPKNGGLVLMGDGAVKKMTAEEFKDAPKAKKK